jgi:hypothetical protein
MAKKNAVMKHAAWIGFGFPARILVQNEIELLSPMCAATLCKLPGLVVELQTPLTPETADQPLIQFTNDDLKFYCAYHAPFEVPAELTADTDLAFFEMLCKEVVCPRKSHRRYLTNCVIHMVPCLKRCEPIKKETDLDFKKLRQILLRGQNVSNTRKREANDQKDPTNT